MTVWVVATMDAGVLHRAATKRACLGWLAGNAAPVLSRRCLGSGEYEYVTGYPGEDRGYVWWVMTRERALANGFDLAHWLTPDTSGHRQPGAGS